LNLIQIAGTTADIKVKVKVKGTLIIVETTAIFAQRLKATSKSSSGTMVVC
jgi:hypothetical protein